MKSISKVEKSVIDVEEAPDSQNIDFMKSALMLGELHRLGEARMNEIIKQVLENAEAKKSERNSTHTGPNSPR